jgi:23S rRNA U2552 (ribose-2'-O)-methylase RlmE/FtsJ
MRDPYVKKAREEDWRCRSAFKLLENEIANDTLDVITCRFVYSGNPLTFGTI